MSNIEKIKAEIERLYDGEAPKHDQQCNFDDGYFTGLSTIENFINSLPEEKPSEELEEAAENLFETIEVQEHENIFEDTFKKIFIAGVEWQKKQMIKEHPPILDKYYKLPQR